MRVVVFADFDNHGALVLVRALLAEVDRRAGWNVVALCEAGPAPARPEPGAADRVLARVRRAPLARPAIERLAARRQLTIIGARGRSLDTEAVTEEVVAL
ncbi:MAG TPA: hypothetical protein DCS55_02730, partial [Acidimicrobiaceae bacterium]|nr:hypothetical protein [Acidimicrobiaceae bacterium]